MGLDVTALDEGSSPLKTSGNKGVSRVRLSPEELALIDSVRGTRSRGDWVRRAALWAAERFHDAPPRDGLEIPIRSKGTDRTSVAFRIKEDALAQIDSVRSTLLRDTWIRDAAIRVAAGVLKGQWVLPETALPETDDESQDDE